MEVRVTDYVAKTGNASNFAAAIQQAIDACHKAGGGRVIFPSNQTFLSGSLVLKAGVELHLEAGAVLLASSDYEDYLSEHSLNSLTRGQIQETVLPQRAFISGYQAHGASITGVGEINGNADGFILERGEEIHTMRGPEGGRNQYLERPFTLFLVESDDFQMRDVRIADPAFWAVRLSGCDNARIEDITIETDMKVPNADGIDIDRCDGVLIRGCNIRTADDCISLKSCAGTSAYGDVANVLIADCVMETRSGAITLGTESVGDIRDVVVEDCTVRNSNRGLAIRAREGGEIRDVIFRRCVIETRAFAPEWWGHGEALHVTAFRWNEPEFLGDGNSERLLFGRVRNIVFEHCEVQSEGGILVWGQESGLINQISFSNINVVMTASSEWSPRIDLRPNDVSPILQRPHNCFEIVNASEVSISAIQMVRPQSQSDFPGELLHSENSTLSEFAVSEPRTS